MKNHLRCNLPGQDYLLLRNVIPGQSYLRDCDATANAVMYCEALRMSQEFQVPSIVCVQPDGLLVAANDVIGERSEFAKNCHRDISLHVRRHRKLPQGSHVYEHNRSEMITILDEQGLREAFMEVHKLLDRSNGKFKTNDPGSITPDHWGTTLTYEKPAHFGTVYPDTASVRVHVPRCLAHLPLDVARRRGWELFHAAARDWARERKRLANAGNAGRRGGIRRYFGTPEAVCDAMRAYAKFVEEHETARVLFKYVDRDALFPLGTVKWRRVANVHIA